VLRLGALRVSQLCLTGCGIALALASGGTMWMFVPAALLLGCVFAPETPASSHLLMRIAPPRRRGLIFSLKQTGNQIGGIAGALALPALVPLIGWQGGVLVVACLCGAAALLLAPLRRTWETPVEPQTGTVFGRYGKALKLVRGDGRLRAMALASGAYSAMQISLNAFLVSFCVVELEMTLTAAGVALAVAQTGGLVGRVFWGVVGDRLGHTRLVLGLLGLAMAGGRRGYGRHRMGFPGAGDALLLLRADGERMERPVPGRSGAAGARGPCQRGDRGCADHELRRPCPGSAAVRHDGGLVRQLRAGLPDHGRLLPCGSGAADPAPN
jgi:hypothetical protein